MLQRAETEMQGRGCGQKRERAGYETNEGNTNVKAAIWFLIRG